MNILVVAHYQGDGSPTAIFVHEQIRAFMKAGHQVKVIVPIACGKRGWSNHRFGVSVQRLVIDQTEHYFLRYLSLSSIGEDGFNGWSASVALRYQLAKVMGTFIPDIIHAHTIGLDSYIGAWLKKKYHCPLVVTTHGSDTSIPLAKGKKKFLKRCCDQADRVVAVSSVLANKLKQCKTTTPICSILNGFNVQYMPTDYQKKELSFIQVGHLIPQKKVDITIRAFAQIRERYPVATLRIIGSGSERGALEGLCHELGIDDSVCFMGQVSNQVVMEEMAKAQFFVMPSIREGFGIVYIEAMAAGCITIGTEGEGIADLIVSGENGLLVPPNDPDAIVCRIMECLNNPKKAAAIAKRGREAATALTWERNISCYTKVFASLIERIQ